MSAVMVVAIVAVAMLCIGASNAISLTLGAAARALRELVRCATSWPKKRRGADADRAARD